MEAKKIIFPLEGFNLSGGIRIIIQVANGLAEFGHDVSLVVPDYAATPPFDLHERIQLRKTRTRGGTSIKKAVYALKLCLISTRGADVSFATGYKTPYYLCFAKYLSLSRAKLVYLVQHYEPLSHASQKRGLSRRLLFWLAKLSYRLPLTKIAVSEWIKQTVGDEKILVINNGIDLATFRPANGLSGFVEKFTIGTIASNSEWKGHSTFLAAIRQLPSKERDKLHVIVASQFPVEVPIGVSAQIVRPSSKDALIAFYRACDVFVCSSVIEGFGLPGLEAMGCGVPVITTDCGGVRQYANDTNCLMVPPGDSIAIATAIVRLRLDDSLRASLREKGLQTSQQFSLERMISEYCRLF